MPAWLVCRSGSREAPSPTHLRRLPYCLCNDGLSLSPRPPLRGLFNRTLKARNDEGDAHTLMSSSEAPHLTGARPTPVIGRVLGINNRTLQPAEMFG